MQNQPQVNDTQGTHTLPEQQNADRKKNVNKRFQNGNQNNGISDDVRQIKSKDLRKPNRIFL